MTLTPKQLEIIKFLATNGKANRYEIEQSADVTLTYRGVHNAMDILLKNILIKIINEGQANTGLSKPYFSLTFPGLLSFLSIYDESELSDQEIANLLNILNREGEKQDFPVFSECQDLYTFLGKKYFNIILHLSNEISSMTTYEQTISNFIKEYTNDKIILRNLYARDRKYKYERLQPYQEKNGKKTFFPDARSIQYEESQSIQEVLERYIILLDSQLQNRFTENFFISLYYALAISMNKYDKILNKEIYDAGNKIIHARRMDIKNIEEVISIFR